MDMLGLAQCLAYHRIDGEDSFCIQTSCLGIPSLHLPGCITLEKLLNLSVPISSAIKWGWTGSIRTGGGRRRKVAMGEAGLVGELVCPGLEVVGSRARGTYTGRCPGKSWLNEAGAQESSWLETMVQRLSCGVQYRHGAQASGVRAPVFGGGWRNAPRSLSLTFSQVTRTPSPAPPVGPSIIGFPGDV